MFPNRTRPIRLSNRNCCYSNERIAEIDAKSLDTLSWSDFEAIFTLSACTAKYDEQLYYLPVALSYLAARPDDGPDFVPGLVHFIASHREALIQDNYYSPSIEELRRAFAVWTAQFSVVHFDASACAAKGWRIDHDDIVENSGAVKDLIDALVTHGLSAVADDLVRQWQASDHDDIRSAWLLEFAKEQRSDYGYYSREEAMPGGVDMTPT